MAPARNPAAAPGSLIELPKGAVHVWVALPDNIRDPSILSRYETLLTDSERERLGRYRHEQDRQNHLVSRALVRFVLSQYVDVAPEHWDFTTGQYGKPRITDDAIGIHFNLSHTRGMVICGVSRGVELGVDVQVVERNIDIHAMANRFFSPMEKNELRALPPGHQLQRFYDLWVLKESCAKALGEGFDGVFDQCSFSIEESPGAETGSLSVNRNISVVALPDPTEDPANWRSWLVRPRDGYHMAVCLRPGGNNTHGLSLFHSVPLRSFDEFR